MKTDCLRLLFVMSLLMHGCANNSTDTTQSGSTGNLASDGLTHVFGTVYGPDLKSRASQTALEFNVGGVVTQALSDDNGEYSFTTNATGFGEVEIYYGVLAGTGDAPVDVSTGVQLAASEYDQHDFYVFTDGDQPTLVEAGEGTLAIAAHTTSGATVTGAKIGIDGAHYGVTDDNGVTVIQGVPFGKHIITVDKGDDTQTLSPGIIETTYDVVVDDAFAP
jgi:hypothetical protein